MKSSVQDEKFSKIKSKCCALKKNIFAIRRVKPYEPCCEKTGLRGF